METEKPSVSLAEIISCLEEMDGVEVPMAAVSRALKHTLPSGPYTRKKNQELYTIQISYFVSFTMACIKKKIKLLGFLKALCKIWNHFLEFLAFVSCLDSNAIAKVSCYYHNILLMRRACIQVEITTGNPWNADAKL